jgi:hypothetical protein
LIILKNRDKELISKGWERRSVTEEKRLVELIELYESLDFEVHLEPMTQDLMAEIGDDCDSCFSGDWGNYKIIYTRKRN